MDTESWKERERQGVCDEVSVCVCGFCVFEELASSSESTWRASPLPIVYSSPSLLSLALSLESFLPLSQLWHAPSITDIMIQVFIASPKAYLILLYPFRVHFFILSLSFTRSNADAFTRTHTLTQTHTHTRTLTQTHTHTHTHSLLYTRTNPPYPLWGSEYIPSLSPPTPTHPCVHTPVRTHTHAYTHIRAHTLFAVFKSKRWS